MRHPGERRLGIYSRTTAEDPGEGYFIKTKSSKMIITYDTEENCDFCGSFHYLHKDCEEDEKIKEVEEGLKVQEAEKVGSWEKEMEDNDDDPGAIRACLDVELAKLPGKPVARFPRRAAVKFPKRNDARFLKKPVTKFPGRAVVKYPEKNVVRLPKRLVTKFLSKAASRFPRRPVAKFQRRALEEVKEVEEDEEVGDNDDDPGGLRACLEEELARTSTGAEVFAALKGAVDVGLDVPHSDSSPGLQD